MKKELNKKAVSPVITTILLVLIAIVLAVIFLLWAKGFGGEQIVKDFGGEEKDISMSCQEIKITAQNVGSKIYISNDGSVPIYKVSVKLTSESTSQLKESTVQNILPARSKIIDVDLSGYNAGDEIVIIPILLGKNSKSGENTQYLCNIPEATSKLVI